MKAVRLSTMWVRPRFGVEYLPLELLALGPCLGRLIQLLVWLLPVKAGGFQFYRTEGPGLYCRQSQFAVNVLWFGLCLTWNRRVKCRCPDELTEHIGMGRWGERRCRRCGKVIETWGDSPPPLELGDHHVS